MRVFMPQIILQRGFLEIVNGRDDILQIKAKSAMLGCLNAPSPFAEYGWFNTVDLVEVDGDYVKILGRVVKQRKRGI